MSKKTKWRTELPEGSTFPIRASMQPIFAGRRRVISGLLGTDLEVGLKRTETYWMELLALSQHG